MKKLSKEAEAQVLDALSMVADVVNDGSHPNDAIVKAAQEHGIPAGHIGLMVAAYNTGRTGKQRMAGGTPLEKAATFDMADSQVIMGQLFPATVKSAAQVRQETAVDVGYSRPPAFARRKAAAQVTKRQIDWKLVDSSPESYASEDTAAKRAFDEGVYSKRRYEDCRREVAHAGDQLRAGLEKISNYFRTPGGVSYDDACDIVEIQYGGFGRAVMNQVSRDVPQLSKEAGHVCKMVHPESTHERWLADEKKKRQEKSAELVQIEPTADPWVTIRDCIKVARVLHDKKRDLDELSRHLDKKAMETLRPFVPGDHQTSVLAGLSSEKVIAKDDMLEKSALGLPTAIATNALLTGITARGQARQVQHEDDVGDYVEELDDPVHAERLRAIRVRAQLEGIIANDPVISTHDPEDVMTAYNEIVSLTPRAADQVLLMRNLLRQHLEGQGAIDPYDVQQNILGAEKALKDTEQHEQSLLRAPGSMAGEPGAEGGKSRLPDEPSFGRGPGTEIYKPLEKYFPTP